MSVVKYLSLFVRIYLSELWAIYLILKRVRIINYRVFVQTEGKLGLSLYQKSSLEPSVQRSWDIYLKMRQLSFTTVWHLNHTHDTCADEQSGNNKYPYLPRCFTHQLKQIIYISENIDIDINIHRKIEYMNFTNVRFFSIWTDKNAVINMHRSVCRWVLAT